MSSPIATVEELLKEVKAIYGDGGIAASQDTYEAKKRVQLLADKVKREVLGPLEYTILIGGMFSFVVHPPVSRAWKLTTSSGYARILPGELCAPLRHRTRCRGRNWGRHEDAPGDQ